MPLFSYSARDQQGQAVTGTMEASSEAAVADVLLKRQQFPIRIQLQVSKKDQTGTMWPWQRVSLNELIVFTRQMFTLMKAGIPMIRAIVGLADSTSSRPLKRVLLDLTEQLEKGRTLSMAMAQHPKVFSRLVVALVHVGENTGRLDEAFLQLSAYFEQELETRKQIKQATRYPSFVVAVLLAAMVLMNLLVIPQFASMFARFNAELPWATQFLIASSNLFIDYWKLMLAVLIGGVWALKLYLASEPGRYRWSFYKLKLPIMGSIITRATLGRFSRSFSMMLAAGVPLTSALNLVADAVDNDFMAEKIREMRKNIERGESLLRAATHSTLFTPLVLQMIAVGEETGQVDDMLKEVASFYEREVGYDLKGLTAKIEPILVSAVAAMVLILALGIFTPMWDMMNAYK